MNQRPEQQARLETVPRPDNLAARAARREARRRRIFLRLGLIALAVLLGAILDLRVQTVQEEQRFQREDAYFTKDDLGATVPRDIPTSDPTSDLETE